MSAVWDLPDFDEHEGVHLICDPQSGLKAVIAIHSTKLGPAAGAAMPCESSRESRSIRRCGG
jgi:leucine dehydrogenase